MHQRFSAWTGWAAAVLLWAATAASAAVTATDSPGPASRLVSVEWLQKNLSRDDVLVLDASPGSAYRKQHIPGAVAADLFTFGPREAPPAQMEARLRAWGANPGQRVVIMDPGATYLAAKLFWDLLHAGLPAEQLFILDGGLAKWLSVGGAVTSQPSAPRAPGAARLGPPVQDVRVRLPEFLAATADPQRHVMLEALDPEYFYGGAAFFSRGGHVPHATLMPADDFYNADKTFKSGPELARMLQHLGIRPEQQVLTYCGGGGAAAVPFFALKFLLGYPQVKLFQESQLGWLQDERELPMWTSAAPYLTRDTAWLKAWASPMLKTFGLSQVTAVDVRAADSFKLGHVPLALNLPAATWAAEARAPERLAALLAAAGLDPSHEAVVFSEGGLNEAAALAFVLLERMGQNKVSIHLDNLDRWIDQGLEVARPAAEGAAQPMAKPVAKPTAKPTTPPTADPAAKPNPARLRTERYLTGPGVPAGIFPTVYVASGAQLPTRQAPGPVIHLPYAQLLQANGRPKAADQIWSALAKAGLPRYARVVVFADQPGEAAVNYVLFKQMGLADVVIWAP